MMIKRYQVFVSSTYADLITERQEVMQALLELDCIPSGMELFPAANEGQWSLIRRVIDECDYYLVIVGGRYGSLGAGGLSYTEMEYRYALEAAKPVIAFLHKDPEALPAKHSEKDPASREKLHLFRALCERKVVRYWQSPAELGSVVSRSLVQLIRSTPAVGWVRGDALAAEAATVEILKQKQRIEELERQLAEARTTPPAGTEGLASGQDTFEVDYSFSAQKMNPYVNTAYSGSIFVTWDEIFAAVAPHMMGEARDATIKKAIEGLVETEARQELAEDKDLKGYRLRDFEIAGEAFQTIKVQLRALGLITKSVRPRSVKDTGTYWTLTPYGDTLMTQLRAVKRS